MAIASPGGTAILHKLSVRAGPKNKLRRRAISESWTGATDN
jgi:hypothetical protein